MYSKGYLNVFPVRQEGAVFFPAIAVALCKRISTVRISNSPAPMRRGTRLKGYITGDASDGCDADGGANADVHVQFERSADERAEPGNGNERNDLHKSISLFQACAIS